VQKAQGVLWGATTGYGQNVHGEFAATAYIQHCLRNQRNTVILLACGLCTEVAEPPGAIVLRCQYFESVLHGMLVVVLEEELIRREGNVFVGYVLKFAATKQRAAVLFSTFHAHSALVIAHVNAVQKQIHV